MRLLVALIPLLTTSPVLAAATDWQELAAGAKARLISSDTAAADGKVQFTAPKITEAKLKNGLRVLVVERHDFPSVSLAFVLDRGICDGGAAAAIYGRALGSSPGRDRNDNYVYLHAVAALPRRDGRLRHSAHDRSSAASRIRHLPSRPHVLRAGAGRT